MSTEHTNAPRASGAPVVGRRAAWLLAASSGVLCPIGFVGIGVWPVAFIAWAPLIVALQGQSLKRSLALSFFAGCVMTPAGFYWLVEVLETFSGFPLLLCLLFASVAWVQMAGRLVVVGLAHAAAARKGWHPGVTFVAAFALGELAYPVLFPWYYGAALHDVPVLLQSADLGGPILVSVVVIAANLALAELLIKPLLRLPVDRKTAFVGVAVPIVALAYGAVRMDQIDALVAEGEPIVVGLVQANIPLKDRRGALAVHQELSRELEPDVDLIVWSESTLPRSFDAERYEDEVPLAVTSATHVPTIAGVRLRERLDPATREATGRRVRYWNSALISDGNGRVRGRYDKQRLLMFGEYLPFAERFPGLYRLSRGTAYLRAGTSFAPLPFGEHRIAAMICYEDILPGFVNELVAAGAPNLLVNMTNDAWFGDTSEPWIHLALAKFRAVEHRLFLVRATNSGVSAIIDPVGRTPIISSGTFRRETLKGEVVFLEGRTVYGTLGDAPWWAVSALLVLGCFVRRRRDS